MDYPEEIEKYRLMQFAYYSSIPAEDEMMKSHVVGCYSAHEEYPYEKYLLEGFPEGTNLGALKALDFGCGPGRMIRRLAPIFKQVDGVDISPTCVMTARRWCGDLPNQPELFVNDGVVLNGVPDEAYDFVYSTIAFHHINAYDIRLSLLFEFERVLKPGGRLAIQMFYTTTDREHWPQHTSWRESKLDAPQTNGYYDVRVTPDNVPEIEEDLRDVGFTDLKFVIAPYPSHPHPKGASETDWIFIHARKPE